MKRSSRIRASAVAIGLIGFAGLCVAATAYFAKFHGHLSAKSEAWEAFGAYLGGAAGTIIGLATLCTLAFTWAQQVADTEEARYAAHRQTFDSTFFQLLHRFSEVSSSVHIHQCDGRFAFQAMYNSLAWPVGQIDNVPLAIESMYWMMYRDAEPELGPYFRTLYHVFKFVYSDSVLTDSDKIEYANVVRAQLSKYELLLLFYNCLAPRGAGFKYLVEWYGILKHMNEADLLNLNHKTDATLYSPTAFMSHEERLQYRRQ